MHWIPKIEPKTRKLSKVVVKRNLRKYISFRIEKFDVFNIFRLVTKRVRNIHKIITNHMRIKIITIDEKHCLILFNSFEKICVTKLTE